MSVIKRLQFLNTVLRGTYVRNFSLAQSERKYFIIQDHSDFIDNVMNSDIPVIVNFHADWCEPCHILSPKLKELVGESEDIALAEVDVEKHADLVHTFEVKAVPAVLAIKNGLVIDKFIGLVDGGIIEGLVAKLSKEKNKKEPDTNSNDH